MYFTCFASIPLFIVWIIKNNKKYPFDVIMAAAAGRDEGKGHNSTLIFIFLYFHNERPKMTIMMMECSER